MIHSYTSQYAEEMVRLKCSVDLLRLGVFPDFKEITESFAIYKAVLSHLPDFSPGDPTIKVVVVGDGKTPRTGATFAFRSRWEVHSVDPKLNTARPWDGMIQRLHCHKMQIEQWEGFEAPKALVVAVHSHARLHYALARINSPEIAVLAMPCCVPQKLDTPPFMQYRDTGIWSPKNEILIWRIRT